MQTIDATTSVGTAPSAPGPHWVRFVFTDGGGKNHELDLCLPDDREAYHEIIENKHIHIISETPISADEAQRSSIMDDRYESRRAFANAMNSQIQ